MISFYNEAQAQVGETSLRLVVNMRSIDAIETITQMTMPVALQKLLGNDPPMTLSGKILWGMLREHHPDITLDQALELSLNEATAPAVGLAMGDLFRRTFNLGEAKDENPPKRPGRSKRSTSSGSDQG